MQHLTVKTAVAETTELGHFAAIAAAYSTDRQGERIVPGAFALTIARWQGSGKQVPLHWNHGNKAEDIVGSVDPQTMIETEDGLFVEGDLDIHDSDVARQAWRSVKKSRVGLSFGYLTTAHRDGADGTKELVELDLFEITLTPTPANADTRVLETKSLGDVRVRRFEC